MFMGPDMFYVCHTIWRWCNLHSPGCKASSTCWLLLHQIDIDRSNNSKYSSDDNNNTKQEQ